MVPYAAVLGHGVLRRYGIVVELIKEVGKKVESLHGKMDSHSTETKERLSALRQELHETKEEVLAKADAILGKIGKLKLNRRKCKHTLEQKKVCYSVLLLARDNVELKSATKTGKATHEAIFQWYKRQLKLVGVDTLKKFKDVINSLKVKKCTDQKAALEAKREAERKAKKKPPKESIWKA